VAISYIIGIYISHKFTTLSGDVASVWFPSAITLPAVFYYGIKVFPGIIFGSVIGLTPSILELNPPLSLNHFILFQGMCAFADLIQPWTARYLITRFAWQKEIFTYIQSTYIFIISAIFTPLISAFIGVGALFYIEIITSEEYAVSLSTWWLASALAHIVFSPTIMLWGKKSVMTQQAKVWEFILVIPILFLICLATLRYDYPVEYLLLPILIWSVFRLNRFNSSLLVSLIALAAIFATGEGYGVFVRNSVNTSFILLQCFTGVLSLTVLILSAVLSERKIAKDELEKTLNNLETKILGRTRELEKTQTNLRKANETLAQMANIDGLTQVANRGCFDRTLVQQWKLFLRKQEYLSLLMIDVDFFKLYNDTYGHQQGDECLINIARCFQSVIRSSSDCVARYGGEEFVIILPFTDSEEAVVVAEKIQDAIFDLKIIHESSPISDFITLSIGIASMIPSEDYSPSLLVEKADNVLYLAKEQGRNKFRVWKEDCD